MLYRLLSIVTFVARATPTVLEDASASGSDKQIYDTIVGSAASPYVMIAITGMVCYLFLLVLQPTLEKYRPNVQRDEGMDMEERTAKLARMPITLFGKRLPRNYKALARLMARKEERKARSYKAAGRIAKKQVRGRGSVAESDKQYARVHSDEANTTKATEVLKQQPEAAANGALAGKLSASAEGQMDETVASLMKFLEHEKLYGASGRLPQDKMNSFDAAKDLDKSLKKLKVQSAVVQALQCVANAKNITQLPSTLAALTPAPPGLEDTVPPYTDFDAYLSAMQNKVASLQERAAVLQSSASANPAKPELTQIMQKFNDAKLRTSLSAQAKAFVPGQAVFEPQADYSKFLGGSLGCDMNDSVWKYAYPVVH